MLPLHCTCISNIDGDGIDEDLLVVYSGTGLRGYGQLVIVKHNATFLSAYAHNNALLVKEGQARQPRVIDVSIEYLRSGRPLTTYARAEIKKVGRRIANVHVEAWQDQRAAPIAATTRS